MSSNTDSMVEAAITIALSAHSGQTDKAGRPYILHPLRLMARMKGEESQVTAVLHDVIEDSALNVSHLYDVGFSAEVVRALDSLTRREGETYAKFIERVCENQLATKVKIADVEDNMDLSRIKSIGPKDLDRVAKYHRALIKLNKALEDK